ncbi:MAG: PEP-CTERM/exosortase system-associated acyltransferase [Elusimicrobia bacterium]|nr:PEP-CTERM/exosortase system-associated acyltransferase [Elusimicrobiota bacterium]
MYAIGEFRFLVATTPDLLDAVHRLRYQVYVEEYGYEKPEDHPAGLEKDAFDSRAIHMAALDGQGRVVGTIRLILNSELGLPALQLVESHYQDKNPSSKKIVEVSRFALTRSLRGKAGEEGFRELDFYLRKLSVKPPATAEGLDNRVIVLLGLIHLMFTVMRAIHATDLYIMAERRLWLLLKHHKMKFRQVSPEIDYHGKRACFVARSVDVAEPMLGFRRVLTQTLARTGAPANQFQLPALLEAESFDLAGFRFQVASSEAVLEKVRGLNPPERREGLSIQLAALDREGRAAGAVRLVLNAPGSSKKEGAIAGFALAPEHRVPIQGVLDPDGGPLSVRECRKAAVVALGLMRLLYWVGKGLRLTTWRVNLPDSLVGMMEGQGIVLHALGSGNYQIRLSEVEGRLLHFQGLRESFKEILAQRQGRRSPLEELLNRFEAREESLELTSPGAVFGARVV